MLKELIKTLIADEGLKKVIYLDHLGHPTVGVGHLITDKDPEYGKPVGTVISTNRVKHLLLGDIEWVMESVRQEFDEWDKFPEEAQVVIASMMFQLGLPRFRQFKRFAYHVRRWEWLEASYEMLDSKWAKQDTPNRAKRLAARLEKVNATDGSR